MKYDIFISYRRSGGKYIARTLKESLKAKGYNVFLDYDNLTDGHFDVRILRAIESAPIFMLILSEGCLDRCHEEEDWVRKEIEFALTKSKHIIPINPDKKFSGFPSAIPDFIRSGIGQHQFSVLDTDQLYNVSLKKIIHDRIDPIVAKKGTSTSDELNTNTVYSNKFPNNEYKHYDFRLIEESGKGFVYIGPESVKYGYYTYAEPFMECGFARVEKNQQSFVINTEGKRISFLEGVDRIFSDSHSPIMAIWEKDKRVAYFRIDGTVIADVNCEPSLCTPFRLFHAFVNGKIIDENGRIIKELLYDELVNLPYDNNSYLIRCKEKWMRISYTGKPKGNWMEAERLHVDWRRIDNEDLTIEFERITGERRGPYIDFDWKNKEYITPDYSIDNTPIRVYDKVLRKYSFINSVGKILFDVDYDMISRFYKNEEGKNVAHVYKSHKTWFLKKDVFEIIFDIDEFGKALV